MNDSLLSNGELQEKIAELQAYKDVNEDFKKAWKELKEENKRITLEAKKLVAQYSAKLEWQRKILAEIKEIVSGTYEVLDSQALQEIRQKIAECEVNE